MINEDLMRSAIAVAESALKTADVPVGALIVDGENNVIATGYNEREAHQDPTAHAEIVAIRRAAQKLGTWRLDDCKLVVTLEPCAMCAGAIAQSRIGTLVFGAWDEKAGAVGSVWDVLRDPRAIHKMEVIGGVLQAECAELLTNFFREQ
ncbi:MAG: nucleoside deaminase [Actinobacteria bacterium]|nr:nucleoside deaminase [Actinomycetota bacterium]